MVIIATMVAKIYFPESLERGRGHGEPGLQARSFYYRRAKAESPDFDPDGDNDDEEDDMDEDDEEELLCSEGGADGTDVNLSTRSLKRRHSSFLEDAEHQSFSKIQVLQRLAICSIMLNVTFVTWGVLQVRQLILCAFCTAKTKFASAQSSN